VTATLVERASSVLESLLSRRNFITRSAFVGSAVAVGAGLDLALRPGTAYGFICACGNAACGCGSTCCSGFSEFCCSVNGGYNYCPSNTVMGGWWKADNSAYCAGPRYYMDCNATCQCDNGCGGSWHFCEPGCDGVGCGCGSNRCDHWAVGCFQFRYGQCNQDVNCMGRIVCRVVACIPPWEIDPSCTTAVAVDEGTATHNAPCWSTAPPAPGPFQYVDASAARFAPVLVSGLVHAYKRSVTGELTEFISDHAAGRVWNAYDLTAASGGPPIAGDGVPMVGADGVEVYARAMGGHLVEFVSDHQQNRIWNAYDLTAASGGPALAGDTFPVTLGPVHVYARAVGGHLLEFIPDHQQGRIWNAYDLTAAAAGPALVGDPAAVVVGPLVHVYVRGLDGHLVEFIADHQNGQVWNAYDLTVAASGPVLAGDPAAVIAGPDVHIYAVSLAGDLVEFIADHQNGKVWNAYDLTADAAGPQLVGAPMPAVVGDLVHVYARRGDGHLVEFIADHQQGRIWNAYDLTAAAAGPALAGDPAPIVIGAAVHIYATAAGGDLVEFVSDHQQGRIWNAYDLTVAAAGPQVTA
jgi:hypothetical protein